MKELLARGVRVGKDRVQRLMHTHGIKARSKRKFVVITDSKHDLPIADKLLARDFTPAAPDRVWSSDITYIATDQGWLYLAAVIDLFSRQVVGWSMGTQKQPAAHAGVGARPSAAATNHLAAAQNRSQRGYRSSNAVRQIKKGIQQVTVKYPG